MICDHGAFVGALKCLGPVGGGHVFALFRCGQTTGGLHFD